MQDFTANISELDKKPIRYSIATGEAIIAITATFIVILLGRVSQDRSIEEYALWLYRILLALAFLFENRFLFSGEIFKFFTINNLISAIGVILVALLILVVTPFIFMDFILLPSILVGVHIFTIFQRQDQLNHLLDVNPWVSIPTLMILFDCFIFLKVSSLLGLAVYHFLTGSTDYISNLLSYTWAASTESLFPYTAEGNNQYMLKVLCSIGFITWQKNRILYIPVFISWIYLSFYQYQFAIENITVKVDIIFKLISPILYPFITLVLIHYVHLLPIQPKQKYTNNQKPDIK